jgi:hypothetical protein
MNKKHLLIFTWALIMVFAGVRAYGQNPASQAASQAGSAASQAGNAAGNAASQTGDAVSHAATQAKDDTASALGDPDTKARVETKLQKLSSELNLTDDQKTQLKPVLQGEVKQLKAIHDDSSLSADQKQQKMTEIHEGAKSQIGSILTPDQQKKLAELKESDDN